MDKFYADTVRLLLAVTPEVFANDVFALKAGTAINLFVQDMPRLSVDIDVVYRPWDVAREAALNAINHELTSIAQRHDRSPLLTGRIAGGPYSLARRTAQTHGVAALAISQWSAACRT